MTRSFRAPGEAMPAKPPPFPPMPVANRPPYRLPNRSAVIRAAIAKADAREEPE